MSYKSICYIVLSMLLVVFTNVSAMGGSLSIVDSVEVAERQREKRDWWEENQTPETRFRPKQLAVPLSLCAVGALGIGAKMPLSGLNTSIRDGVGKWSNGAQCHFDDYVQYAPVAFYLTLDFMGLEARHSFGERVAVGVVTYASVTALSQGLKYVVREPRPDTGTRNSFPSGHTATAFAGAELVRTEYGWGAGTCAYAAAATVGFMRIYNDRHWFNDVVAGAGIGILSARIGYWMLPLSRHLFGRSRRAGSMVMATPTYDVSSQVAGLTCAVRF